LPKELHHEKALIKILKKPISSQRNQKQTNANFENYNQSQFYTLQNRLRNK